MTHHSLENPVLSICIPAYNRPIWLQRAILSIFDTPSAQQVKVEVVVSDDSITTECAQLVERLMKKWQGPWRYCQNLPSLGMAANWNHSIRMACGQYVLVLHDDDYLEKDAVCRILKTIEQGESVSALLFGVNVVTETQQIRKQQVVDRRQYLDSASALERVLTDSSFIRFPGMVVKQSVFKQVGYFDETVGSIADIHMWVRICHQYGLLQIPITTANYTVHGNALTMQMFTPEVTLSLEQLFDDVYVNQWTDDERWQKCKSNYFHQFILAGTVRFLRVWNFQKAWETFSLLKRVQIQYGHERIKWKVTRQALKALFRLENLLRLKH